MKKQSIYLVANYVTKPKNPKMTHIKGYMTNPENHQYDEQVAIQVKLRRKDINSRVILNLSTKTVERNGFNQNKDFNEMFKYFFKGYHKYITEIMSQLDPEYFNQMLDEMQKEIEEEKNEEAPTE